MSIPSLPRPLRALLAAAAAVLFFAVPASAADEAAARATVERLHAGLEYIMANGPDLGLSGRADHIDDVVDESYNLRQLAAQSIGPAAFRKFTAEEQADVTAAYRTFVIANYASQFKAPSPAGFTTVGVSEGPSGSLIVTTELGRSNGDPVELSYVVVERDGETGIVDVLYGGVSEAVRRRSEFGPLAAKGADAVARALRVKAEQIAADAE